MICLKASSITWLADTPATPVGLDGPSNALYTSCDSKALSPIPSQKEPRPFPFDFPQCERTGRQQRPLRQLGCGVDYRPSWKPVMLRPGYRPPPV